MPSTTQNHEPQAERAEAPLSTLPKPLMRMQEFVEGTSSSASAASVPPVPAALTVGSMGPPPSPSSSHLRFQPSQLPEPARSHSPNLPRSRTLAPAGPPSQYKVSIGLDVGRDLMEASSQCFYFRKVIGRGRLLLRRGVTS